MELKTIIYNYRTKLIQNKSSETENNYGLYYRSTVPNIIKTLKQIEKKATLHLNNEKMYSDLNIVSDRDKDGNRRDILYVEFKEVNMTFVFNMKEQSHKVSLVQTFGEGTETQQTFLIENHEVGRSEGIIPFGLWNIISLMSRVASINHSLRYRNKNKK